MALNVCPPLPITAEAVYTLTHRADHGAGEPISVLVPCVSGAVAYEFKNLSFADMAQSIGRNEVATAAIFYGQASASPEDIQKLSSLFNIHPEKMLAQLSFPDRVEMPPREPLIYRLYEI
ncbi:hypothetical protein Egran_06258 [Elaphomyces granulatus]|uniref:Multiprotein-bridging factor 1 n=1 Tax=Elaphomyces granulatus TaxID=519963 RepID=A0A232LPF4_9EURO|nr:hypothetical protein Egran_06258 [Elaphomyces granulatus]